VQDGVLERSCLSEHETQSVCGELTAVFEMIEHLKGEMLNFFLTAVGFYSHRSGHD
jgi:hypothetical protein